MDDFYKVYGYACFYKSDVQEVNVIKADNISITFVCHKYPRNLITHLAKERHWNVSEAEYEKHKDNRLYKSVMDIIVRANQNRFQEVKHMCDALRELMEPEFTEMKEQVMAEGLAAGREVQLITQISKKLQKGKNISTIAEELEEEPKVVERICEAVKDCAPNSDAETIYKRLKKMIACL